MMVEASTPPQGPRRGIRMVLGLVLLAAVVAGWYGWRGQRSQPGHGFRPGGMSTPVAVAQARDGAIDRVLRALGTVTSPATVTIRSRVDGPLQSLHFVDGQSVREGELLAVIDPRPFEIQLRQAQGQQMQHAAQLDNARRDLARYERLVKQDSIARQQLDAAQAQVRELEGQARVDAAAVDDARLQLGYTRILAPGAGRLGLRKVDVGNMVHASDADGLVVLTQNRPIDVLFSVPQARLPDLLQARRASPELDTRLLQQAGGPVIAEGRLVAVDNQIDVATGTVRLKARFDNADESLFPNQFVQVRLLLGRQAGVVVPLRAVQRSSAGEFVYRLDEAHTAHVVPVTTGVDDGTGVVIESGLKAGDTVVVEGTDRLREGSKVEIIPAEAAGASAVPVAPPAPANGGAARGPARGPAS